MKARRHLETRREAARADMRRSAPREAPAARPGRERWAPGALGAADHDGAEAGQALRLSVIAPCFNEEASLDAFVARTLAAARTAAGEAFEIILVNDGSRDGSWDRIQALSAQSEQVVGVNLSRNHGQQLAVTAGLTVARGDRVLVIDADLQDPPELLADMMALMDQGYDVVYGQRQTRDGESRIKLATAKLFYRLLHSISEVEIPQDVGDFRLMSRRIVDRLNQMPERDRFFRGMVSWLGGRQVALLYHRDARLEGKTAYTLSSLFNLAVDALVGFSTAPLKIAVILAGLGVGLGMLIAAYVLIGFVAGNPVRGWTSLALVMVFFGVSQLACLGIVGAYVGRIFVQVKGRPLYMIDDVVAGAGSRGR